LFIPASGMVFYGPDSIDSHPACTIFICCSTGLVLERKNSSGAEQIKRTIPDRLVG